MWRWVAGGGVIKTRNVTVVRETMKPDRLTNVIASFVVHFSRIVS